jgi:uncharacterized protein involved in cysteine biosynthesis
MKLNDPFGRLEKKHQAAYQMMREAMQRGGITTIQAAQDVITRSKNRTLKFLAVVLAVLLLALALFPRFMPAIACLAILIIVWAVNSLINGRKYVQRYIDEELRTAAKDQDSSMPG